MERTEQDAIRRVLAGDRDAYRVLMDCHFQSVYRVAFRVTANEEDAEEAAQEAFLRAYRKLPDFRGDAKFGTWVYRIAMRCALDVVERRTRDAGWRAERVGTDFEMGEVQVMDERANAERILLNAEAQKMREAAMATLTPMERTAFALRHMEEVPMEGIAEALGVPVNSAKQAVWRAVKKLRGALAPVWGKA